MSDPAEHLYGRIVGHGPPLLFVYGLGGSARYWGEAFEPLSTKWRLAFVDLAGFGRSRTVAGPYDIEGHVRRLAAFRGEHLGGDPLVIVGHAFGAVLAFAAAAEWQRVAGVVAFGLPAFSSAERARARLASLGVMERWMATGATWARLACWAVCHTRPLARATGPLLRPDLPPTSPLMASTHLGVLSPEPRLAGEGHPGPQLGRGHARAPPGPAGRRRSHRHRR